ncbi:MAG TPA: hypothetical protein VHL80_12235 [Polyangia bacterium]|nr:hypothetical protein [Polyangia bacterium]
MRAIVFRAALRALIVSSMLAVFASPAAAGDGPGAPPAQGGRAGAERGDRKAEALKRERPRDDPDDADDGLQKNSKAGEKRAEPDP